MRSFVCYILLCLSLTTVDLHAAERRIVHFTVFLRDNAVIRLDSRQRNLNIEKSAFDIITYKKEGESFRRVSKMQWPQIARDIYSIDLVNSNVSVYSKAKLLLTGQDGTQREIQYGALYYTDGSPVDRLYYSEYNRMAGRWTDVSIPIEMIRKLVLGTTRLMINPETGILYPPYYRYAPHTGKPLVESALKED